MKMGRGQESFEARSEQMRVTLSWLTTSRVMRWPRMASPAGVLLRHG